MNVLCSRGPWGWNGDFHVHWNDQIRVDKRNNYFSSSSDTRFQALGFGIAVRICKIRRTNCHYDSQRKH